MKAGAENSGSGSQVIPRVSMPEPFPTPRSVDEYALSLEVTPPLSEGEVVALYGLHHRNHPSCPDEIDTRVQILISGQIGASDRGAQLLGLLLSMRSQAVASSTV